MSDVSAGRRFFEGQIMHLAALAILVLAVIAARRLPGFDAGSFLGLSTEIWAILAIADAVLH